MFVGPLRSNWWRLAVVAWVGLAALNTSAALYLSEILWRPPGSNQQTHQYLELRGPPNLRLPDGVYCVAVEGDAGGNPGVIQNIFDLSGQRLGGNGFLVVLQKSNTFSTVSGATVLAQRGAEEGFGHGSDSTVNHRGEEGRTDLEGPSVTFFLIQTTNRPALGDDLDANNDGVPDAPWFASWTLFDSVGVLDNTGAGDFAYGAINFRRNPASQASGNVVPVNFTADYVARVGHSTGAASNDWVAAGNLAGSAPVFALGGEAQVSVPALASTPLNHVGGPNFGAPPLPGVLVQHGAGPILAAEGGSSNGTFTVALNTVPAGRVTLSLSASAWVELSADGGSAFAPAIQVVLSNTAPVSVRVRAPENDWAAGRWHRAVITLAVAQTEDAGAYPLTTLLPDVPVEAADNDPLLLNEIKVNPPGLDDAAEYVELAGLPHRRCTNLWFLVIAGHPNDNPGKVLLAINLSGQQLDANGLLFLGATNHPYSLPAGASVMAIPSFSKAGGVLPNTAVTFLLLSTSEPVTEGEDWDRGDNGRLEGLPPGADIVDSLAFLNGSPNAQVYSPAILQLPSGVADAAARFPIREQPNHADAWFFGQLLGPAPESLEFDNLRVSEGFPYGALLTPGEVNYDGLLLSRITPVCGAIGDPTNPRVRFTLTNLSGQAAWAWVVSDNPDVVASSNLVITPAGPNLFELAITPHGVGYATLSVEASDGAHRARVSFAYAASAMGRPGGRFHAGAADASTAIPLDADWMLVGDDENQVLRLYHRYQSGLPVWQTNMTPFLGLTDIEGGQPREVDIEASVRVGNRIFWLGAHSHANIAETRTNRSRLFATDLSGSGTNISLAYAGRYDYLKLDLVNWDATNGHGKGAGYYGLTASTEEGVDPKTPGGFNLEGLAMAPGSDTVAYVGFRAPILPPGDRARALIVPVLNLTSLAGTNLPPGSAVFGEPIELDLFGRGIRSLEGGTNGYLIIAGTPLNFRGPYPDDFKLYVWTGLPHDPPQELTADLTDLNPEGIVELPPPPWTSNTLVQIISDNGVMNWYGDGIQAKFLPVREFRKCRSDWVALGNITPSAPLLKAIAVEDGHVRLRWRGVAGQVYRVQARSRLEEAGWTNLSGDLPAASHWLEWTHTNAAAARRFYRIAAP